MSTFNTANQPRSEKPRWASCFNCAHFVRVIQSDIIECGNPMLNPVNSQAHQGCAFWMREPGADDDR